MMKMVPPRSGLSLAPWQIFPRVGSPASHASHASSASKVRFEDYINKGKGEGEGEGPNSIRTPTLTPYPPYSPRDATGLTVASVPDVTPSRVAVSLPKVFIVCKLCASQGRENGKTGRKIHPLGSRY